MSPVIRIALAAAATVFIAVSGIMNALFLSSLGRTPIEGALLTAVSVAADVAKAVLPILVVRAVIVRAWSHCIMAMGMLAVLLVLSLASGTGFAALTRNAMVAHRDGQADALAARRGELRDIEEQLGRLATARQLAVVEADLSERTVDRRWTLSKSCMEINGASVRRFCSEVAGLRSELANAASRDRLTAERRGTRMAIEELQSSGAGGDRDPQAAAIAALLRVNPSLPRIVLPVAIAVVLELGAVILVLLWAGPTVQHWQDNEAEVQVAPLPKQVSIPVRPPHPADPVGWQLQLNRANLANERGESHAR